MKVSFSHVNQFVNKIIKTNTINTNKKIVSESNRIYFIYGYSF